MAREEAREDPPVGILREGIDPDHGRVLMAREEAREDLPVGILREATDPDHGRPEASQDLQGLLRPLA